MTTLASAPPSERAGLEPGFNPARRRFHGRRLRTRGDARGEPAGRCHWDEQNRVQPLTWKRTPPVSVLDSSGTHLRAHLWPTPARYHWDPVVLK